MNRIAVSDLDPKAVDWMQRAIDEHLRRNGQMRALVLRMLAPEEAPWEPEGNGWSTRVVRAQSRRRGEPTGEDLAAALLESPGEPIPPVLLDYAARVCKGQPRKTGPKARTRTTWEDIEIIVYYQRALRAAVKAHEADDSPSTRAVCTRAKTRTAKTFGLSVRTIEGIVAPRPLSKSSPK